MPRGLDLGTENQLMFLQFISSYWNKILLKTLLLKTLAAFSFNVRDGMFFWFSLK